VADEQVREPGADEGTGLGVIVHAGHGVVALGHVAQAVHGFDLLVDRQLDGDGLIDFESPDAFGALGDEAAVAFFAASEGLGGLAGAVALSAEVAGGHGDGDGKRDANREEHGGEGQEHLCAFAREPE
jgi:hypothetical protein